MAEHVRARITAAKVGVGLAFAGLIAGVVERVRPQPAERLQTATLTAKHFFTLGQLHNKITSAQIKNHTLLYKDFKYHQVASYAKVKEAFLKIGDVAGESTDTKHNLSAFESKAFRSFLLRGGTAVNSAKVGGLSSSELIQGHGHVFSGVQEAATSDQPKQLVAVPGLVTVSGGFHLGDVPSIHIVNVASSSIDVSWNDGQTEHQQTMDPNGGTADLDFPTGRNLITAQLLSQDNRPITLTLSTVPGNGSARFVAQALVGG